MGLSNTHQLKERLKAQAYNQLEAHIVRPNASALERLNLIFIAKFKKSIIFYWSVYTWYLSLHNAQEYDVSFLN